MLLTRLMALAAFLVIPGSVVAEDLTFDNPEFASWSKFKKGTTITVKTIYTAGKLNSESVATTTLVEVGADKLVLESTSVTKIEKQEIKSDPQKRDVPKTFTVPKPKKDPKAVEPPKPEEGTATLKVAGSDLKTKWYKTQFEDKGTKTETTVWMSDDVPGGMVKTAMKSTGAVSMSTTMEVTEIKKP